MISDYSDKELFDLVNQQISNFWMRGVLQGNFSSLIKALNRTENNFLMQKGKAFQKEGKVCFSTTHSVQYAIFYITILINFMSMEIKKRQKRSTI